MEPESCRETQRSIAALPEIAQLNKLKQSVGNDDDEHRNHDDALPWFQVTAQTQDSEDSQYDDGYE